MTYDEFIEEYKPVTNHINSNAAFDGCMFETFGTEKDFARSHVNSKTVWTIVEEDGKLSVCSGYCMVNRMGYFITKKPWGDEGIEFPMYVKPDGTLIEEESEDTPKYMNINVCADTPEDMAAALEELAKAIREGEEDLFNYETTQLKVTAYGDAN